MISVSVLATYCCSSFFSISSAAVMLVCRYSTLTRIPMHISFSFSATSGMNVNTIHTHSSVCVLSIFHLLLLLISFVFVFDFTFVVVAVVRIFSRQTYTHTHSYKLVHCVEHDFSFSFYMPKYCFPPSYTIVSHMHTAVRSLLYGYVDDFYTGSHISLGLLQLLFAISHSISQLQMK